MSSQRSLPNAEPRIMISMLRRLIVLLLTGACLYSDAHAEPPLSVGGYYKNFFVVFDFPSFRQDVPRLTNPQAGSVTNRVRLRLSYEPADWLLLSTAYDFSPTIQDSILRRLSLFATPVDVETGDYRALDFDERLFPFDDEDVGSFAIFHNLDRLFATLSTGVADITVGRQPVAWGSARVVNPTDILVPFRYNDLDREERFGVDAVRMLVPLGALSLIDVGYVFGSEADFDESAVFVRPKLYVLQTDLSIVAALFQHHLLAGIDLARAIGGVGTWLEAAYVVTELADPGDRDSDNDYLRISAGGDYRFTDKIYGYAEYHFSAAGESEPRDYLGLLTTPAFEDGAVYLLGRHYAGFGATYEITPLAPLSLLVLVNASDWSVSLFPQIEYNIAPDVYVSLGGTIGFGKKAANPTKLRSEFGALPDFGFTSFRWYF